jgi:uncharacterized integral membrane protein
MRALLWAVRIFIFLFLFAFSLKNSELVSLHFMFDTAWQAPLVMVVLAFFTGGALVGALSLLGTVFGLRQEVARLGRELKRAQAAAAKYPAVIQPPPA